MDSTAQQVNISEVIDGLMEQSPIVMVAYVEEKASEIGKSGDTDLIHKSIDILATDNRYQALCDLWLEARRNSKELGTIIFDEYANLDSRQRDGLVHQMLKEKYSNEIAVFGLQAVGLSEGTENEETLRKDIMSHSSFQNCYPISALHGNVALENYQEAGKIAIKIIHDASRLNSVSDLDKGREIGELIQGIIDKAKLEPIIRDWKDMYALTARKEGQLFWDTKNKLEQTAIQKVDNYLSQAKHPEKAFEAAGDAALEYKMTTGIRHTKKVGDYKNAIHYYFLSRNFDKLLSALSLPSKEIGDSGFFPSRAVFEGYKALWKYFSNRYKTNRLGRLFLRINFFSHMRSQIQETYGTLYGISGSDDRKYDQEMRVEAAALIRSFSNLKNRFWKKFNEGSFERDTYRTLNEHGMITDTEMYNQARWKFLDIDSSTTYPEGQLEAIFAAAKETSRTIHPDLIIGLIDKIGLKNERFAKVALDYLRDTGNISPAYEKMYTSLGLEKE